jgi:parallel beta-helix repeat protein
MNAECLLCHETRGSASWNGYGWDFFQAFDDVLPGVETCDGDDEGTDVSIAEALICIQNLDSDQDIAGGFSNIEEILESTQPGWTEGPNNTIYTRSGTIFGELPPDVDIGSLDPGGAGGTGGGGGTGGTAGGGGTGGDECNGNHDPIPPGQIKRSSIVVKPGQSIQKALDMAQEGTKIYVHAGIYEEPCNLTNGLNITKSGIHLIGQSKSSSDNEKKRVIIQGTGDQRNGIVIVPPDVAAAAQPQGRVVESRTDCMGCHTDMGPPFPLHPDVPKYIPMDTDPYLYDIKIEGITVEGFDNNGFFTEHVDGFVFANIRSIDNLNYGIFPVLSKNGIIRDSYSTGSTKDSALWVETSEHVLVQGNVVEKSTNGIEVSNSDDILVIDNEMRNNTIGAAILLLPDIFGNRGSAKRIDLYNNWIHDNNLPNGARPGSILGFFPAGQGILFAGVDDSVISGNLIENNDFIGIAIADYCGALAQTDFACPTEPDDDFPEGFLLDQAAENNTVVGNVLVNNATNPDPDPEEPNPFAFAAADLSLLTLPTFIVGLPGDPTPFHGNCYEDNLTSSTPEFFALWYAFLFENPELVQPEGPFPPPPFPPWAPPSCP